MEFSEWVKFLLVMTCAVYRIDPSELGFQFKDQTNIFGQAGQKERLQHSKDKGLKPILVFLQEVINYYLVSELDEDFEFVFTGVDAEEEKEDTQKSFSSNPIMDAAMSYIEKNWGES
jgi:hypothetical protein